MNSKLILAIVSIVIKGGCLWARNAAMQDYKGVGEPDEPRELQPWPPLLRGTHVCCKQQKVLQNARLINSCR